MIVLENMIIYLSILLCQFQAIFSEKYVDFSPQRIMQIAKEIKMRGGMYVVSKIR